MQKKKSLFYELDPTCPAAIIQSRTRWRVQQAEKTAPAWVPQAEAALAVQEVSGVEADTPH